MSTDQLLTEVDSSLRDRAVKRLKKRRDLQGHLLVYALVNSLLIVIWFMTGANGFFWPIFPIAFWGIGVVMNVWDVYRGEGFTDEQIDREMARLDDRAKS